MHRLGWVGAFLVLASGPIMAAPFHHPNGEWREYNQDWLAACPDAVEETATDYYGFSCFASTGSAQLNGANLPAYKLTLMLNRLTGALDVALTAAATDGPSIDPTRPLIVRFNGEQALSFDFGADLETRYNTINQYYVVDPARRDALIEAMKSRNAVTLSLPVTGARADHVEIRLSLRGVTASLDFMSSYARRVEPY